MDILAFNSSKLVGMLQVLHNYSNPCCAHLSEDSLDDTDHRDQPKLVDIRDFHNLGGQGIYTKLA